MKYIPTSALKRERKALANKARIVGRQLAFVTNITQEDELAYLVQLDQLFARIEEIKEVLSTRWAYWHYTHASKRGFSLEERAHAHL